MVDKPVLGKPDLILFSDFLNFFCKHAPRNKISKSTNFIFFGPTDKKLWMFENLRRSLGRASMCWSQPTRVDYINPKRWATWIKRFERSLLRVSSPVFWTLPLHLEGGNLPVLMELRNFIFIQIIFF
jgi:hypothetical protein